MTSDMYVVKRLFKLTEKKEPKSNVVLDFTFKDVLLHDNSWHELQHGKITHHQYYIFWNYIALHLCL